MNKLGLYIHFPFCERKCLYCDFYSVTDTDAKQGYLEALFRQIEATDFSKYRVDSIYIGGGTPSIMEPDEAKSLMSRLRESYDISPDCEISLEANPNSLTSQKLAGYREAGFNRISIGMQSSCDSRLVQLGRLHENADTERAVKWAREAGFDNLSLDLIYGLPEQTVGEWKENLEAAVSLAPEHISFYCLTLEEDAPLYKLGYTYPDDGTEREMYFAAADLLESRGYGVYEISNCALPGHECRHNKKYWDLSEYYGFGPSAHSYFDGSRFSFADDLKKYIRCKNFDSMRISEPRRTKNDILEEYIMLSLRTYEGFSMSRLKELCRDDIDEESIKESFERARSLGLVEERDGGYALTRESLFVSNAVIVEILDNIKK